MNQKSLAPLRDQREIGGAQNFDCRGRIDAWGLADDVARLWIDSLPDALPRGGARKKARPNDAAVEDGLYLKGRFTR